MLKRTVPSVDGTWSSIDLNPVVRGTIASRVSASPLLFSQAFKSSSPRFTPERDYLGKDPRELMAERPFRGHDHQYWRDRRPLVHDPFRPHASFLSEVNRFPQTSRLRPITAAQWLSREQGLIRAEVARLQTAREPVRAPEMRAVRVSTRATHTDLGAAARARDLSPLVSRTESPSAAGGSQGRAREAILRAAIARDEGLDGYESRVRRPAQ